MTTTKKTTEAKAPVKRTRRTPARKVAAAKNEAAKVEQVQDAEVIETVEPVVSKTVAPAICAPQAVQEAAAQIEKQVEEVKEQVQKSCKDIFEVSKEQWSSVFKLEGVDAYRSYEESIAFNQGTVDALIKSSNVAVKGIQDVSMLWAQMAQRSVEESMAASQKMMSCGSLQEAAEIQSKLMTESYDHMMSDLSEIQERSQKIVQGILEPLTERCNAAIDNVGVGSMK